MTVKLYWEDPYQRRFSASILEQFQTPGGTAVVLDQTCFYATSGGQPHDRGTLNGKSVGDVREDGDRIVHVLSDSIEADTVEGEIDWVRRFDHMQQHSGQHILSAAFFGLFQAETSSFHLGEDYCSIELNRPALKEGEIQQAEESANHVVTSALTVSTFFIDPSRASEYPLRKKSDLAESLRLVQIGDFDLSPCSGTHVRNTGEIGGIFILDFERLSQTIKINFVCGHRIRKRYHSDLIVLKSLSKTLTTSFDLLPESVGRLQTQVKELRKELSQRKEEDLKKEAAVLFDNAPRKGDIRLMIRVEDRSYQEFRFLAQKLSEREGIAGALLSTCDRRGVFFKNRKLEYDLKAIFERFLQKTGAKGGGPPHFLEAGGFETDGLKDVVSDLFVSEC